jgi:hypothetical protein
VTTSEFEATDEAFFNAAYDDAPVSEAPVTFDLEAQEPETEQTPAEAMVSERLRARRTRLTQAVVEIVSSLALVSSLAAGMHLVRSSAASSSREAAAAFGRPQQVASLATAKPIVASSVPLPAGNRGKMASGDQSEIPSGSDDALPTSEPHQRDSVTWRARPTAPDSAARLRSALRRYRPAAGDRVAPGS